MIYTLTLNPSLDYIVTIKDFSLGKTNRTETEQMFPGGKGINVSIVLENLGIPNQIFALTAGFVGQEIERKIHDMGLRGSFIRLREGNSRINIKMKDFEGTEINGKGPVTDKETMEQLYRQLDCLEKGDFLVLAGSVPLGMTSFVYCDILKRLSRKGIHFVVDATRELLLNVLECRPFLIKPNHHELGEIFGVELTTREEVVPYAKKLQEKGARNVLVSMAGDGAVLVAENGEIYEAPVPEGKVINAVGAGDSMVAGFLAGYHEVNEDKKYQHAFKKSVAAGSASAYSEFLATKEEIEALYERIQV